MQEKIDNLPDFLNAMMELLKIIDQSSQILFRKGFRENYAKSLAEALPRMEKLTSDDYVKNPQNYPEELEKFGLVGAQLDLKLESFRSSLMEFQWEGGLENLELALDKGGTLLSSLAAAIPGFGSFAQELVDFIIKELKRRFKFWKK